MTKFNERLYEEFCEGLSQVEARYRPYDVVAELPEPAIHPTPRLIAVEGTSDENDQDGDVSGKIATLNDRFRQNQQTNDSEIKGEWVLGDDINRLEPPTKAAILRRVSTFDDFEGVPLHDKGSFVHESKGTEHRVIWMIKVYEDANQTSEAVHPEDPDASYRTMLLTLSEE